MEVLTKEAAMLYLTDRHLWGIDFPGALPLDAAHQLRTDASRCWCVPEAGEYRLEHGERVYRDGEDTEVFRCREIQIYRPSPDLPWVAVSCRVEDFWGLEDGPWETHWPSYEAVAIAWEQYGSDIPAAWAVGREELAKELRVSIDQVPDYRGREAA